MKKYILYGILLVAVVGSVVAYRMYNKPFANMEKAAADFTVDAKAFYSEFEADEAAANTKYLGKVIEVSGAVREVKKDEAGKVSIVLDSGSELAGVVCELDELSQHPKTDFAPGDQIKIKGNCTGILMDVVLVRCVVVN